MPEVDADAVAEEAVREGWSWGLLAEYLLELLPDLDPERTVATLERVARQQERLGPLGATKAAVRAALAEAPSGG